MTTSLYTPLQRVALSFAALDRAGADWRQGIIVRRLSFTDPGWDPATQLFGSLAACLGKLRLHPGSLAALGFAPLDDADREPLRVAWRLLLGGPDET